MPGEFQVGDTVQLKSGGSIMTIEEIRGNEVSCAWFDAAKLERGEFSIGTLKKFSIPR